MRDAVARAAGDASSGSRDARRKPGAPGSVGAPPRLPAHSALRGDDPVARGASTDDRRVRILAIADAVSPFVYSERFPDNLPAFDIVLSAGDMPGHVLEFLATKLKTRPVYVLGNHHNAYLRDQETQTLELPGGCVNAHGRVFEHHGVLIAGIEGSGRYRPGPHQYTEWQMELIAARMAPRLLANRWRHGRAVDVLLTHAAPVGPHEGEDYPHRGIPAFNRFHRLWKPRVHVHGHVHLSGANAPREYVSDEGVRVVNAFGFTIIDVKLTRPAVPA